jgi:hypothetical protein
VVAGRTSGSFWTAQQVHRLRHEPTFVVAGASTSPGRRSSWWTTRRPVAADLVNSLRVICFTVTKDPWRIAPNYLRVSLFYMHASSVRAYLEWNRPKRDPTHTRFIDHGRGDGCVVIAHFGRLRGIREAIMNGYLPYSSTGPAPRFGGIRGWQENILRGES